MPVVNLHRPRLPAKEELQVALQLLEFRSRLQPLYERCGEGGTGPRHLAGARAAELWDVESALP